MTPILKSLYFLEWCPSLDSSPLLKFSKFNNFLWVCWFLGKNLSNFVPPDWKLDNSYHHIKGRRGKKKIPTTTTSIIRRPKVSKTVTPSSLARTTKKPLKFAYRLLGQNFYIYWLSYLPKLFLIIYINTYQMYFW